MRVGTISFTIIAALLQLRHHAVSGRLIAFESRKSRGSAEVFDLRAQVIDAPSGADYTILSKSIHDALDITMTNQARQEGYSGDAVLTYPQVIRRFPELGRRPTAMLLRLLTSDDKEIIVNTTINARSIPASDKLRDLQHRNVEEDRPCFLTGYAVDSPTSRVNINTCNNTRMTFKTANVFFYMEGHATDRYAGYEEVYATHKLESKMLRIILPFAKKYNSEEMEDLPLATKHLNIDIRVVVDDDVTQRHGLRNIGEWVKYMVKKVDDVYQDKSLKEYSYDVHVNLLDTVLLRQGDMRKMKAYLKDLETDEHDFKPVYQGLAKGNPTVLLFLTSNNIREARKEHDVVGATPCSYNGICSTMAPLNYFLVDKGAWTIMLLAQKIGKSLGFTSNWHSSQRQNNVMQDGYLPSLNDYNWTPQNMYSLFQHNSEYGCLLQPSAAGSERVNIYPGEVYSLDQQCAITHGSDYIQSSIMYKRPCQVLLCMRTGDKLLEEYLVETTRTAVLDGTWCADEKWCWRGACVRKVAETPIDGEWSEWGRWSPCSRSCGTSLRTRERKCNSPSPSSGGRDCGGENHETQVCDRSECSGNPINQRTVQCSRHQMIASYSLEADETCKLFCKHQNCNASQPMFEEVRDGESCFVEHPSFGYCSHGKCVMECEYSEKDRCGVCGGDGSSCRVVRKHLTAAISSNIVEETYGENAIIIPSGARNVYIWEARNPGKANIYLQDDESSATILYEDNNCPVASIYQMYQNVVWKMKKGRHPTSIRARGPLTTDVRVTLVGLEKGRYELKYSYIRPN